MLLLCIVKNVRIEIFRRNMAQLNPQLLSLRSEMIKDRVCGALSNLISWNGSLPITGVWEQEDLYSPFQHKIFSDSSGLMTIYHMGHFSFPSLFNTDFSLKTFCLLVQ